MLNYVFVYGTLMKGEQRFNHPAIIPFRSGIKEGHIIGAELYDLGDYPGMVLTGNKDAIVYGEVQEFISIERIIKILDRLERFNPTDLKSSLFRREEVNVILEDGKELRAYAYIYNQPIKNAKKIPSGRWRSGK